MASPSSAEATEPAEDADWKGVRGASGAQAPASVVVMNVPDVVDADALLQRFGAVLRSSGQGAKDTKEEAEASSPSSSSVRFTVKTWCIDGADVPVRIAFVDITGGQHAVNAIISAYNGTKWFGNKISVQRVRRRYYVHQLREEWEEQQREDEERRKRARMDTETSSDTGVLPASYEPIRIASRDGRGTFTVSAPIVEKKKAAAVVRLAPRTMERDAGGGGAGRQRGVDGKRRLVSASMPHDGHVDKGQQEPWKQQRGIRDNTRVYDSCRDGAGTSLKASSGLSPGTRGAREMRLDNTTIASGNRGYAYDSDNSTDDAIDDTMNTEEAIAREREQHRDILAKLFAKHGDRDVEDDVEDEKEKANNAVADDADGNRHENNNNKNNNKKKSHDNSNDNDKHLNRLPSPAEPHRLTLDSGDGDGENDFLLSNLIM